MLEHDSDERSAKSRFSRRVFLLGGAQAAGFGVLGWRLFQLQVLEEGHYAPLADENRINLQILPPKRGRILDRNGLVLADSDEIFRATLTPSLAGDVKAVLGIFQRIVPLTGDDLEKLARRIKKLSRTGTLVLATDLSFDQVAQINVFASQLPGIRTDVTWRRRYAQGAAVGHITGFVGSVEKSSVDAEAIMRLPGTRIGKSGIEASFETDLRGNGGAQKIEVDARGRTVRNLETLDAQAGRDVTLTIDAGLQKQVIERLAPEGRASCAGIDIVSGEIVLLASTPGYDPAQIAGGMSKADWQRLLLADDKPLLNRAVSGQYAPGATIKVITALAALQSGVLDAEEKIMCDGHFESGDQTFRCWKRSGHGPIDLRNAIRTSCDVYFDEAARRAGIDRIADMARSFGFGAVTGCGLSEEKTGLVPDPKWKLGRWNTAWLESETLQAGAGQGYMLATPLQLTVMAARIAGGLRVVPSLAKRDAQGPRVTFEKLKINDRHLADVRDGMIALVNSGGGVGATAALGAEQALIAAIAGGSQASAAPAILDTGPTDGSERENSVFVAYVPAYAPRYAFAAIIEHGGAGGAAAGLLVRDVISFVLQRDAASRAAVGTPDVPLAAPQLNGSPPALRLPPHGREG